MTMLRNEHIVDLIAAIEARLSSLCPTLAFVGRSQATSYKDLARLIPQLNLLPAAVVVLGPIDSDQERSSQGSRPRVIDIGIMLVGEYSAAQDEGAPTYWAVVDAVHDVFTPAVERSEKAGLPVAVLGTQDGPTRGTLLIPAGYRPLSEVPGRCAGVYNLLALDTIASRSGTAPVAPEPEESEP